MENDYKADEAQAHIKYGYIDLYHAKRRREMLSKLMIKVAKPSITEDKALFLKAHAE